MNGWGGIRGRIGSSMSNMGSRIGSAWGAAGTGRQKSIALGLLGAATIPFAHRMRRRGKGSNNKSSSLDTGTRV